MTIWPSKYNQKVYFLFVRNLTTRTKKQKGDEIKVLRNYALISTVQSWGGIVEETRKQYNTLPTLSIEHYMLLATI